MITDKNKISALLLGLFLLIAGLSKFLILEFWMGYEPRFIVEFLPLAARQITLMGGVFEAFLGMILISGRKTFYTALITTIWIIAMTLQMLRLGLWDMAIRDIGLVFFAISVALMNYNKN